MKKTVSIHAFSANILTDWVKQPINDENMKIRPVLSSGQVIAPLAFFEKGLDAEVSVDGTEITVSLNGAVLKTEEGERAYSINGKAGEFSVPVRKEKDYLCLPAVETARALGLSARQYGQLAVFADEERLEKLASDEDALSELVRKTVGSYNAAYFTAEDFRKGRDAWRRDLCGDEKTNDLSIPGMKNLLEMRDQDCDDLRREMNHGKDMPIVFGTEKPTITQELEYQYYRIARIAQAYGTVGCRNYKSKEVLADLLEAMDWMYDNMYGANVLSNESFRPCRGDKWDWWYWYVGGACPMMDTVMILEDDLTREQINKYLLPMSFVRTQMRVELKPALAMSRILPLTPLALLTEDRALLQAIYVDEVSLLQVYDEGDNMRRDWCCMTHGMPYNICYGACNLDRVAKLLQILDNTPLAFPIPTKYYLMNMVRYTFSPVAYRGRALNLMNGRYMQTDCLATGILAGLMNVYGLFGDEEDAEISRILYRNNAETARKALISTYDTGVTLEEYKKIGTSSDHPYNMKTNIVKYPRMRDALLNPKYEVGEYTLGYMWYSGDSCVQFRNDNMIGLRMSSERGPGYECINGQNCDAWYTGDGMLYVYTPDAPEQYSTEWWDGVDKRLMPGTTAEDRERLAVSIDFGRWYLSSKDFVGGVDLEGKFVTASMDLESCHNDVVDDHEDNGGGGGLPVLDCDLTAMKSWFMMDRVIAAIGTRVNASDEYSVRTVVENNLLTGPVSEVLVNGEPLPEGMTEETREDVCSIFVPKVGGYFFPQGGRLTLRVYGTEEKRYLAVWFDHGVKPECGEYAYVILPNATAEEYAAYDMSDVEILANDGAVQAVREKHSGLTGVVFREAGTFEGITADQPMIVMTQKTQNGLSLVACDPTQKRTAFGLKVSGAKEAASCDVCMTAKREADGVQLDVACDSARGRGYRAELK